MSRGEAILIPLAGHGTSTRGLTSSNLVRELCPASRFTDVWKIDEIVALLG
jgi:hypothetical protein